MTRGAAPALLLVGALAGQPAAAQDDPVTIVAGEEYRAGSLRRWLLGEGYRDLWTTPVPVQRLDLRSFAGGLTPVERGGGFQTRSLRLLGADGREYNFRSVNKFVSQGLPPDLRDSWVSGIVQDQVSAMHPAGVEVATGLLDAVGVLNPGPRLVVMPDDPLLGGFREEFAGLLGTIEAHADEPESGGPGFAGAVEVDGSDDVFALVRASARDRIEPRSYLRDRLMSLLMGDWDRHGWQFRWALRDTAGVHWWIPIPEDRDFAFSHYDGRFIGLLSALLPEAGTFRESYPANLAGLTQNSTDVDRRLLAALPWAVWEETVLDLQRDLTDPEIEAAARRMPAAYFARSGPELIRILRARRDALGEVAGRYYRQLAAEPEIHGTDGAERATVMRLPDGSLRVVVAPVEGDSAARHPLVDRVFSPAETRELRIYLHGGDDAALVEGEARGGIPVRIAGGAGADTLRDRSSGPAWTSFHDSGDDDRFETRRATFIDRTPFPDPARIESEILFPRDWGATRAWFRPWIGYEGTEGPIVGGGPSWTWYGFRRLPYAGRVRARAMYGLRSREFGVDASGDFLRVGSEASVHLHARLSGLEALRYHGFGNATPGEDRVEQAIVRYHQRLFEARLDFRPSPGLRLGAGPSIERLDPDGSASRNPGLSAADRRAYGKAGLAAGLALATRPERGPLDGGFRLDASARLFPAAWDLEAPFGQLAAIAAAYAPLGARALLAGRLGAAQSWGRTPLLDALSLGGSATLRGYDYQRFTGDALVFGGLEARAILTRVSFAVNADLGVLAFLDAGRVYAGGISSGGWHTGRGAGIWLRSLGTSVSATYAYGEKSALYLALALPY